MKRWLVTLLVLLLASLAWAQPTQLGYYTRTNCASLTVPVAYSIACLQTTTTGGRTAGHIYTHNGSAWVDISAAGAGTVTSVGAVGTANQITVTGTSPNTSSGSWTFSIPTNPTLPGTTTGTFSGNLTGNVSGTSGSTTGNSATATALAANGANCSAGSYALGVDASGAAEGCTALPVASTTLAGIAEAAIAAEVTTGTDAARYVTPAALAGSTIFGLKTAQVSVFDPTVAVTVGDGLAYFVIPRSLNGMNLVGVRAHVNTVSSSGAVNVDLTRCAVVATGNTCSGTVSDMLSTNLTIDANESKSATAAAAVVIDTANDDVATDQVIRLDVDGAGTGTLGLIVLMEFQLP